MLYYRRGCRYIQNSRKGGIYKQYSKATTLSLSVSLCPRGARAQRDRERERERACLHIDYNSLHMVEREVTQSYSDSTNDWRVASPRLLVTCGRVFEDCDSRRGYFRRGPSLDTFFKNTKMVANIVHFSMLPVLLRFYVHVYRNNIRFPIFLWKIQIGISEMYQSCHRGKFE